MLYSPESLIATGITLPLIGVFCLGLRFWVRTRYSRTSLGPDDWLIFVAAIFVVSTGILQVIDTKYGQMSRNQTHDASSKYVEEKANYIMVVIEKVPFGLIKLSFLFFYRRIFAVWKTFRILNDIVIVYVILWMTAYLMAEIFTCGAHPEYLWSPQRLELVSNNCVDHGAVLFSFAITDVIGDFLVLGMPFLYIHRLQMSTRQKWLLSAVFLLGFFTTLAGILRLIIVSMAWSIGIMQYNPKPAPDPLPRTIRVINAVFWTNVELSFGLIAANLPPLAPLIKNTPTPKQLYHKFYSKLSSRMHSDEGSFTKVQSHETLGPYASATVPDFGREKYPSCDACAIRRVKCDATATSVCTECSDRNVRCQFTKDTNKHVSSIRQAQILERQPLDAWSQV